MDQPKQIMRHVLAAMVTNEPGVLAQVAGMFAARILALHDTRIATALTRKHETMAQGVEDAAQVVEGAASRDFKSAV